MPSPSDVNEVADLARVAELRADGVELVAGSITDLAGVTRAKYVPLRRLGTFQRAGMGVSPSWSVFCVDSGIAFTPSIGVVGDLRIGSILQTCARSRTAWRGRPATCTTSRATPHPCVCARCSPTPKRPRSSAG